ncbi:22261_t:CDS:2, partial [Racocetra persica]
MRYKSESEPFIYLPTGCTYVSVYNDFKKHFYSENDQNEKIISYFTFRRLWQKTIPHLKFQSPASDLCEVCETFKAKLLVAKSNKDEYDQIKVQYDQHYEATNRKRQHYNNNINENAKNLNQRSNTLADISQIINNLAKENTAIVYNNGLGWTFNNSPNDIGKVYASKESGGIE